MNENKSTKRACAIFACIAGAILLAGAVVSQSPGRSFQEGLGLGRTLQAPACATVDTAATFNIVASHSLKGLAVEGASSNGGANIVQKTLGSGGGTDAEWKFVASELDGYYHIVNENSNLAMNVKRATQADGAAIIQWIPGPESNDNFCLQDAGDGAYYIIAEHSGDTIDIRFASSDDNAQAIQWPINQGANQKFTLETAGSMICADLGTNGGSTTYQIIARHSDMGLGLGALDGQEMGASVVQTLLDSTNRATAVWSLESASDGHYTIHNDNLDGLALNVAGNSNQAGANVILWPTSDTSVVDTNFNDNWCFRDVGDGYYNLIARHSGQALDVTGAGTNNGDNVLQWPMNGKTNQQFRLVDLGGTDTDVSGEETLASDSQFFRSSGMAYDVTLNLLTADVLDGYEGIEELCDDLEQIARFFVNNQIERQSRINIRDDDFLFIDSPEFAFAESDSAAFDDNSPSAEGATDFQTNNQEEGIDEADTVKSDGTHVFAVYGSIVVVWEALTGDFVLNYTLPDRDACSGRYCQGSVRGMSLAGERLVLYLSGYGYGVRSQNSDTPVLGSTYETRIVVFDTSTLPASLDLIAQEDVHGTYQDARSIGTTMHVVTTSYIDYYTLLSGPLGRYQADFEGLNNTEYVEKAKNISEPLIESWVTQLKLDIIQYGAPSIPKISLWQTDLGNNTDIVGNIYSNGAVGGFAHLLSFDVEDLAGDLNISASGAFTPATYGNTYAVDGYLVFATQGYNWISSLSGSAQTTYLLGFELDGASATPKFLGSTPGSIINQYSLSIWEGHLRIATTLNNWWPIWGGFGEPVQQFSGPQNQVVILKVPTDDEPIMQETGRIEGLGKPGETFTAVRFFGDICYAVTFQRTDPFYVLDLTPTDPKVLGELEISGFSSYLHSINNNDTLLVAVGEDADESGRILGLQISLFDATNVTDPILLHREAIEQERDVWSSSAVRWDFKAFRYLSLGIETGIVIIPVQVSSSRRENGNGNFDGFFVYDVSRGGISQRLNVSHADENAFYGGCYYPTPLPQRSLVFNGNLTTIKGHTVISTDLDSFEESWTLEMPKPAVVNDCYSNWICFEDFVFLPAVEIEEPPIEEPPIDEPMEDGP